MHSLFLHTYELGVVVGGLQLLVDVSVELGDVLDVDEELELVVQAQHYVLHADVNDAQFLHLVQPEVGDLRQLDDPLQRCALLLARYLNREARGEDGHAIVHGQLVV